jgi:SNF2 family DNA or RNA helicase
MQLWHHQRYTIDKLGPVGYGLDFSDPGTGKTLAHAALYAFRAGRGRCLITCPSTLMQSAWANDIDTFLPGLSYTLAYADQRFEAFEADSDFVIMNVDGVKAIDKKFKRRAQMAKFLKDFDHLIMDEVEAYKHGSSARSRAMLKVSSHFAHRFGLSATPNPQSVTELWHPSLIVDRGRRLGTAFHAFRNSMQEPEQIGPQANHIRWSDKPQANEITQILLDDITVRHAFEEVMTDVPPNHTDVKAVLLPSKLFRQYKELEAQMVMLLDSGQRLSVTHASSLRSKLLQLCSGAIYNSADIEGEGEYQLLDTYRYKLISDLVEERGHSVVFYNWRHQGEELAKELRRREISFDMINGAVDQRRRPEIVREYQAGQYRTLLVHYKTGAHGLTLTRGTTSILTSPIYEPNYFKQTIHRIYRGGQTEVTNTLLVCAKNTVEELVYEKLRAGTLRMEDFLRLCQESKNR